MFWKNVLLFCLLFMFFSSNYVLARSYARHKACAGNLRLIQSAIELYNMDNKIGINRLDQDVIDNLVKVGYLKSIVKPESKCEYKSIGDLREGGSGIIFCKYHGDVENLVYCDYYEDHSQDFCSQYKKFSQNATEAEIKNNINTIRTNKEKAIKWTKLRQTISFFIFSPFSVLFLIGLIISWYCFPKRKKQRG